MHLIPNTAPLHQLLTAAEATMQIPNQKNGVKGQCIHQECTGTANSPIKSLAHRVHHILNNAGTPDMEIYHYKDPSYHHWRHTDAKHINQTLKDAADCIGLCTLGCHT